MALSAAIERRLAIALTDAGFAADIVTQINNVISGIITGPLVVGSTTITEAELGVLDGVTPGTAAASKALVLDSNKDLTLPEASDIALGTTTGTKIGTATDQKLGFFNATPVVQRTAYTQTYATADRTHAAPTAATLTMADGAGTNDNTIDAVTGDASVIAAFQEVVDEINKLIADVADTKQMVNSLVDDLQALGLSA